LIAAAAACSNARTSTARVLLRRWSAFATFDVTFGLSTATFRPAACASVAACQW
jgi:hypothetical protein